MSDRPLFQNSDEQERAYAPQEVPEAGLQGDVAADEGAEGSGRGTAAGAGLDTAGSGDDTILAVPFVGAGTVGYNTSGNLAGAPVDATDDENDNRRE